MERMAKTKAAKKKGKTHKKRTPEQRNQDIEYIAGEYLRGRYQSDIAKDLNITQQQISYDLKEVRKRWLKSAVMDFDALKAKELAKIDALESELWSAWKNSQGVAKRKILAALSGVAEEVLADAEDAAGVIEGAVNSEDVPGDPRFLQGILKCIERRCAILGLDAPKTIAPAPGEGSVVVERIERVILTADQPYLEGEVEH